MVQIWIWLGRLLAAGIFSLPLWVLLLGPRTGDHFIDLVLFGIAVVISWLVAIVIANLSNDAGHSYPRQD